MFDHEPIHITVPGSPDDPRALSDTPEGVIVHYAPALHPDDVCEVHGIPTTTVSRTLIDLAEEMTADELRGCFASARDQGLLDLDDLAASRARVEWRPSLSMLDAVIAEFS